MSSVNSIASEKLFRLLGTPKCPALIDVRRDEDFSILRPTGTALPPNRDIMKQYRRGTVRDAWWFTWPPNRWDVSSTPQARPFTASASR
jgi:hypothetical protein